MAAEDDLQDQIDDRENYQLRMTKYKTGALSAVNSGMFWILLRVANTTRQPLRRFFLRCQKYSQKRPLLRLVTYAADAIMKQFNHLFETLDNWFNEALVEAKSELPPAMVNLLRALCVKLLVTSAGGFEMRICSMTRKYLGISGLARRLLVVSQ